MVTIRTATALAAIQKGPLFRMDVYKALLQGGLYKEVYIILPQGLIVREAPKYEDYKILISLKSRLKKMEFEIFRG